MKPTILIAWFLVSLTAGRWDYKGPYTLEMCEVKRTLVKQLGSTIAYCVHEHDPVPNP